MTQDRAEYPFAIAPIHGEIDRLKKEIACAERSRVGIDRAIETRKRTLARLIAQSVLDGHGGARPVHG